MAGLELKTKAPSYTKKSKLLANINYRTQAIRQPRIRKAQTEQTIEYNNDYIVINIQPYSHLSH